MSFGALLVVLCLIRVGLVLINLRFRLFIGLFLFNFLFFAFFVRNYLFSFIDFGLLMFNFRDLFRSYAFDVYSFFLTFPVFIMISYCVFM